MDKISANFSRHEFACKCGCGFDTVDTELIMLCNMVRFVNKGPVVVLSGCRCPAHNATKGGAENSQHLIGRAADLRVDDPDTVYEFLDRTFPDKYGFGRYPWGVHVDSRKEKARW